MLTVFDWPGALVGMRPRVAALEHPGEGITYKGEAGVSAASDRIAGIKFS